MIASITNDRGTLSRGNKGKRCALTHPQRECAGVIILRFNAGGGVVEADSSDTNWKMEGITQQALNMSQGGRRVKDEILLHKSLFFSKTGM